MYMQGWTYKKDGNKAGMKNTQDYTLLQNMHGGKEKDMKTTCISCIVHAADAE